MRVAASGLREPLPATTCETMYDREQWRSFFDRPWVEWGLFALGVLLVIGGILISPLPGPGGVFLIAPGMALILKTSMWAKRRYVRFKRKQPKVGHWMDWGLRRRSALRREELRKQSEASTDTGAISPPQEG